MTTNALIAGVGMTHFSRPSDGRLYTDMAAEAVNRALGDACLKPVQLHRAFVGYVYGDSTSGQRALYPAGVGGIPIVNVNNNCATGSTALAQAVDAVSCGLADCVLALGFEQMAPGALRRQFDDRPDPLDPHLAASEEREGPSPAPFAARLFGAAAREHIRTFGTRVETFAAISVKARLHAANNPRAVFRAPLSIEEVLASPTVYDPLTRLQCCPPTSGAAAAIIVSPAFARRHGVSGAVKVRSQAFVSDAVGTISDASMRAVVGSDMTGRAAKAAYESAGVGPSEIQVIELHDCFTCNEILSYEALNLVDPGEAERLVADRDNSYGGKYVINPSGGLLAKGHPLGATGLAQCAELVWQLRGSASRRQVPEARLALQHNIGLGGACVVTILER